ncbi:MAG: molecular chaperone HtpG [Hyphomicrobiales bacterium]|nr:molecular chaperone HtpG [Hyphomicrobiales bacterium]
MTTTETAGAPQPHAFQADVSRLLHLMVHSIYSDRDIFVRELISNAADACEKLRYEAVSTPGLIGNDEGFSIRLTIDAEAGIITFADNGIGMSHDELIGALGTIASSGTRAFLEKLNQSGSKVAQDGDSETAAVGADLIGQFGIGFYSAFMVADQVEVQTHKAGTTEAWSWVSDGKGTFTVTPLAMEAAPAHGTRVMLHLSESSKEYAQPGRLERIVREHSGAVAVPVDLLDKPDSEPRRISEGTAIWARPKSEITPELYDEFYRGLAGQFDSPALTVHWRAEGRHEYTVLAFVPGSRPLDLFAPARKSRGKLYVRRVLITHDADLLPGWLRFVRLVVDSSDLPLNVSREMIQDSPIFAAIRKGIVNRLLQELTKLAESDAETYAKVWRDFGAVLKEGIYEDPERRDQLFKLARFATSKQAEPTRTLADYVGSLRENQTAIWYITGDDPKRLAASPQLEGFRARGIEVLLLSDPVDAFWVETALGYEGKPFKSVTHGMADIKSVPVMEGETAASDAPPAPEVATLLSFMKETLAESVEDVRASDRLAASAACLVAPEHGRDRRLERLLAETGNLGMLSKPVLEINPTHPMVAALAQRFAAGDERPLVEDAVWLIHDEARVADGDAPADAAAFSARLTRVLTRAALGAAAKP